MVGRSYGPYPPLAALAGEFDSPGPADPVHDPARYGLFPVRRLEELELQRRAPAVDGQDPHTIACRKCSVVALNCRRHVSEQKCSARPSYSYSSATSGSSCIPQTGSRSSPASPAFVTAERGWRVPSKSP